MLLLSIKKPYWQASRVGRGCHVTPPCTPQRVPSLSTAILKLMPHHPFNLLFVQSFFPTEGRWAKEMGTLTFLLISTFPLLFNLKCQLLLYKREDHKCKKKKPFIKVEEMTRQRLRTHPRQNNSM